MAKINAYRRLDVGNSEWNMYGNSEAMWLKLEAKYLFLSGAGMRTTLR
jgi:hypothetical protein